MKPLSDWIDFHAPANGPPPRTIFAFTKWALDGSWPFVFIAALFSALAGLTEAGSAWVLGAVMDAAVDSPRETVLSDNALVLIVCVVFFLGLRPIAFWLSAVFQSYIIQPNITNLIMSRLHRFSLGQSVDYFDNDFAGRIAQKELQTARAMSDVIVEILHTVVFAFASIVGSLIVIAQIDGLMNIALLVWIALYVVVLRMFIPIVRQRSTERASSRAMVTGQIVDTVTNIKTVKLFAHADHEDRAALNAMGIFRIASLRHADVMVRFRLWLMVLAGFLPVALVGLALWGWTQNTATAGDIAIAGAVSFRLAQMTGWVSFTLMGIFGNIGEVEDGIQTLTKPHTLLDADNATELTVKDGAISFDAVQFAYGRDIGGVQDLTLDIRPNEKIGIVGASGAGKSTLVSLLLRLYDTEGGVISIDNQDISQVTQESLRHHIGMVTQETAMFNRSALDNIKYGRPDATDEDVHIAAAKAEAHEFILDLQDHNARTGYDAHLGERGVKLSGGQRQRIALARAILKDAPILILDEATSALDSEVEASIQTALERVMEGKTVLAIAHRLSTIAKMDRILVLDRGQIVEDGTHSELLALGGLYARYWARQSGGFIGTDEVGE